jgi:hypothetical protein
MFMEDMPIPKLGVDPGTAAIELRPRPVHIRGGSGGGEGGGGERYVQLFVKAGSRMAFLRLLILGRARVF